MDTHFQRHSAFDGTSNPAFSHADDFHHTMYENIESGENPPMWTNSSPMPPHHPLDDVIKLYTLINTYSQNNSRCANGTDCDCDSSMYELGTSYKRVHGYLAMVVCLFGVIANILIMVVLTRKEMRTPVNLMLFALAMADLLIMMEYIPFALHMYLIQNPPEIQFSLNWARFVFFHNHFTQILHTISIQLTLSMAIWRYFALKCSNQSTSFCTFRRCYRVIGAAYICPLFLCILNYLYFQIHAKVRFETALQPSLDSIDEEDQRKMRDFLIVCQGLNELSFSDRDYCEKKNITLYTVEMSELARDYPILHKMHFWTFSVIIKLIPCVVLTFFMCWLVNTLYKARRHHRMLEVKSPGYHMSTIPHNGEPETLSQNFRTSRDTLNGLQNGKLHASISRKSGGSSLRKSRSDEVTQSALLDLNSINCPTGSISTNHLSPSTHLIQVLNERDISVGSSRRQSGETSAVELRENGVRRFTKGLIRFPSVRRTSRSGKSKRTDRTSKMLVAVLFLFLITEFPQGIMHLLTGWYGPGFFRCYYNTWAEVWDMLALINSAVNFILYCFMSKQFRTQFRLSFNLRCFRKYKFMGMSACNNNHATVSTTV